MNLEGLQIFSHEVSGYKPQVDFNTWRVALLNASDMYLPNRVLGTGIFLPYAPSCRNYRVCNRK